MRHEVAWPGVYILVQQPHSPAPSKMIFTPSCNTPKCTSHTPILALFAPLLHLFYPFNFDFPFFLFSFFLHIFLHIFLFFLFPLFIVFPPNYIGWGGGVLICVYTPWERRCLRWYSPSGLRHIWGSVASAFHVMSVEVALPKDWTCFGLRWYVLCDLRSCKSPT